MIKVVLKPSAIARRVFRERHLAKYRLLEGPVRSAKSFTANDLAIQEIQELPACNVLISGYSISSVTRNVLAEWKKIIDPKSKGLFRIIKKDKDEYLHINWRGLRDKKFYLRGGGKENDADSIQGATFGYWLADELTKHKKSFVDMARTRLTPDYAKAVWTTNPDSPFHFVKSEIIDNEILTKEDETGWSLLKIYTYVIDDNPSLSKKVLNELKNMFVGVFYKRFILGLWVLASGAIYDFFEDKEPYIIDNDIPLHANSWIYAIDYGTKNPCVFLKAGRNLQSNPGIWIDDEYCWDSAKEGKQKTDEEYTNDFIKFVGNDTPSKIIVDPSAASFILCLKRVFPGKVNEANNDVLDGIRTTSVMLKSNRCVIRKRCKTLISEFFNYVWDEKAGEQGEDKPVKKFDHALDALRYLLHTLFGKYILNMAKLSKW